MLIRRPKGCGYDLLIQPALEDYPIDDEVAAAAYMNKVVEKEIMRAPEQYLWLHRRFKTRPAGSPSLY
ncbi:Lipid A biosynthesis lauroyl acyltransferase [compost metagenome]